MHRKSTRTHLKVEHTPVKMPSPETRRRAEAMKIVSLSIFSKKSHALSFIFPLHLFPLQIEPPNMKASAAAVKSIIGEVFSDVSFEEFERASSTVSYCTYSVSGKL